MKYPIVIRLDCVDLGYAVLWFDLRKIGCVLLTKMMMYPLFLFRKVSPTQKGVIQHSTFFSDVPQYPLSPLANRNRNRRFFASICHWNDPGERQVWTLVLFIKGWKGKVGTDIFWCVLQNFVGNTEMFMFWECHNYYTTLEGLVILLRLLTIIPKPHVKIKLFLTSTLGQIAYLLLC